MTVTPGPAEQGNSAAQLTLGSLYHNGAGVERNLEEAVKWYRMAAKQGVPKAQFLLAQCYLRGEGVERSNALASQYLMEAAALGDPEARSFLDSIMHGRNNGN